MPLLLLPLAAAALAQPPAADPAREAALVNRITWGATPAELARIRELGPERYLQAQLHPAPGAALPPEVQRRIDALPISRQSDEDAQAEQRRLRQDAKRPDARRPGPGAAGRARDRPRPRRRHGRPRGLARVVLAQPAAGADDLVLDEPLQRLRPQGDVGAFIGSYEDRAIRAHALGKFRDLLAATIRSPAMLLYLDNAQNAAGKINENYARELMELHTLGVKGGYTQTDVQELARILTGLGIGRPDEPPKLRPELRAQVVQDGLFLFNPARHDYGDKQFLGHRIAGAGLAEVDQAVDLLARHPATAHFISAKLAAYSWATRRRPRWSTGWPAPSWPATATSPPCCRRCTPRPNSRVRWTPACSRTRCTMCIRRCGWPMPACRPSSIPGPR